MDQRTAKIDSRKYFSSPVDIRSSFLTNRQDADKNAIDGTFPLINNHRRWFSHPYLRSHRKQRDLTVGKVHDMTESGNQSQEIDYLGFPWKSPDKSYDSRPIMMLHEEINDFYDYMSPTPQEHAARRAVIRNIEMVIAELWPSASVQVIGSFRTGLYLPTSDINLLVIGNWSVMPLNTLKSAIAKKGVCIENFISVVDRTNGPAIQMRDRLFDFKIEIFFNCNSGPQASELIKQYKAKYPVLGKLALVLKQFLYQRGLHEVSLGGVFQYGLLMMIVSFLKQHPRLDDATTTNANLGVLLMEFFEFYGHRYNYSVAAVKTKRGGYSVLKNKLAPGVQHSSMLCIKDTLDRSFDLGHGSFRALKVRQSLALAYATLNLVMNGKCDDFLPQESILGKIVKVSSAVIRQRATIMNNFFVMSSAVNGLGLISSSDRLLVH